MKLPEVLTALRDEMPTKRGWTVAILTRNQPDGRLGGEVVSHPVFDVAVDDDDAEINLLTDEGSPDRRPQAEALTLEGLLQRLQRLESHCGAYSVYSGSGYMSLDEKHEVRLDCPIVGVARNHENQVYGFLQYPPEQWEATA